MRRLSSKFLLLSMFLLASCAVNKGEFVDKSDLYDPEWEIQATFFNNSYETRLKNSLDEVRSINVPIPNVKWKETRDKLETAKRLAAHYNQNFLWKYAALRSALYSDLTSEIDSLSRRITADAATDFSRYNHFGSESFFAVYPVELDPQVFMRKHFTLIRGRVKAAPMRQLKQFVRNYPAGDVLDPALHQELSRYYFALYSPDTKPHDDVVKTLDLLRAIHDAKDAGFLFSELAGVSSVHVFHVLETNKRTGGTAQFPVALQDDMNLSILNASAPDVMATVKTTQNQAAVIFNVLSRRIDTAAVNKTRIDSSFQSGVRREHNPDYDRAILEVQEAQNDLSYAQGTSLLGGAASIVGAVAAIRGRQRLSRAQERVSQTSPTIEVPVFSEYKFTKAHLEITRTVEGQCYFVDARNRQYAKVSARFNETWKPVVLYGLHEKDPRRDSHLSSAISEDTVGDWEAKPMALKVSALFAGCFKGLSDRVTTVNLDRLPKELSTNQQAKGRVSSQNLPSTTSVLDKRFASVVVVYNAQGNVSGTGFYVSSDLVLTNYHVVEGQKFVEVKAYGENQSFGKVFKYDEERDLALIRVKEVGVPIRFFAGAGVQTGSTVEAIGHPKGLEFSITRGVVSAMRQISIIPGPKKVELIQTDTAVSPGNSGGPLFQGDRVVGVMTGKKIELGVEGIGFAVHYREILEFLRKEGT